MIEGREVSLSEVLDARDFRAARQSALAGRTLVCLTLNIAGPVKRFPLADRAFEEGVRSIGRRLGDVGALADERACDAGRWALFTAEMEPAACKRLMVDIEQTHPIGRLLDIDVIGPEGVRLERGQPRKCLICDRPAHACARSRAHPVESLQQATLALLRGYFDAAFAETVQRAAARALLYELSATPKPGLVDRANNGAHCDMGFTHFLDSATAIAKYFSAFALNGIGIADDRALFAQLTALGIQAEADMLAATGGANTHRGAIFALGLLAAGCGRVYARDERITAEGICAEAAKLGAISHAELMGRLPDQFRSHGERAYRDHGAGGARAEAMAGYPSARDVALPELRKWLGRGASANDASVCVLLRLIAEVEDTNLIARAGVAAARAAREDARRRLSEAGDGLNALLALAEDLDAEFIARHLSPGGCADLLAAAWMIHFLEGNY